MSLETVLQQRSDIWRGGLSAPPGQRAGAATGHEALERLLPSGWPRGVLTELLLEQEGIGELRLVLPALVRLSRAGGRLAWVAPPHLPYAPALANAALDLSRLLIVQAEATADRLWALEQILRSGACEAVLGWVTEPMRGKALRRLQLAAETHDALAFLYRPDEAANHASPAALRLRLVPHPAGLAVHMLKSRGTWQRGHTVIA
jgi:hypothetical protein